MVGIVGEPLARRDLANLKSAADAAGVKEAFVGSRSPRRRLMAGCVRLSRSDETRSLWLPVKFAKQAHSCRQMQNIRLGSAAANRLSGSRNQRADGDG
jgi:hypothetical protein